MVGWGRAAVAEDLAACSPFVSTRASLMVQQVKEFTCGRHRRPGFDSCQEDPLEEEDTLDEEMATRSSILA